MPSASRFIEDLQSRGRYHFSTEEAVKVLGSSVPTTLAALRRLKAKGEIADPHRGFHVVVPPEYRRLEGGNGDRDRLAFGRTGCGYSDGAFVWVTGAMVVGLAPPPLLLPGGVETSRWDREIRLQSRLPRQRPDAVVSV